VKALVQKLRRFVERVARLENEELVLRAVEDTLAADASELLRITLELPAAVRAPDEIQ
jgi:hypothetical protein